jgi:hypothetical protein
MVTVAVKASPREGVECTKEEMLDFKTRPPLPLILTKRPDISMLAPA